MSLPESPSQDTPHNSLDGVGGGYGAGVAGKHDGLPFFKPKDTSTHDPIVEAREQKQAGGGGIGGAISGALGGLGGLGGRGKGHEHEHEREHTRERDGVSGATAGVGGMSLADKDHHNEHRDRAATSASTSSSSTDGSRPVTTSGGFLHRNNHHERDQPSSTSTHHGGAAAAGVAAASAAGAGLASHSAGRSGQGNAGDHRSHSHGDSHDKNHKYDHAPPPADPRHDQVFAETDPTTTNRRGHREYVEPNVQSSPSVSNTQKSGALAAGALGAGAGGIAAAHHSHPSDREHGQLDPTRDPAFNPTPTSRVPGSNDLGPAQGFPSSRDADPHHAVFGDSSSHSHSHSTTGDHHHSSSSHHGVGAAGVGAGAGALGAGALASHHHSGNQREGPASVIGYESHPPSARTNPADAIPASAAPAVGQSAHESGNPFGTASPSQAHTSSSSHHTSSTGGAVGGLGHSGHETHGNSLAHGRPSSDSHSHAHEQTTTTHKPSLADKLLGTTDVLIGKMSHNPQMVEEGKARKSGVAAPSTFGNEGEFLHGAGGKGKHGAGVVDDKHHGERTHEGEPDAYEQVTGHKRSEETKHAGQGFGGLQGPPAAGPMP